MTPVDRLVPADFGGMLGRDAEGSMLEFKVDIPVHPQSQREQGATVGVPPRDAWWSGKKIAAHGRDALLEEVVAFANARGGRLLLGIDEEAGTTLAKEICPLPRIAQLEARFTDMLLSGVEPRLPQFVVRGVETDGEGGGVLAVEVQPSRVGPHRVTGSLVVPVRRGDRCMPMSMAEVHAMVLRNARRFDELRVMVDERIGGLDSALLEFLKPKIDVPVVGGTVADQVRVWLGNKALSAFAVRIVVCAHDDLGIPRLSSFDPFIPEQTTVANMTTTGPVTLREMVGFWPSQGHGERYLGGVRQQMSGSIASVGFSASREGMVEQTLLFVGDEASHIQSPGSFAGFVGCALGVYDLLRRAADRPDMPAEVAIKVITRGRVRIGSGQLAAIVGGVLPADAAFPRRTVANEADITEMMELSVQDLQDSANDRSFGGSKFAYSRTSFKTVVGTAV